MKRILAMLLCAVMVFSLWACGEDTTAEKQGKDTTTPTEEPVRTGSDRLEAEIIFGHNLTDAQVESINHRLEPFYARFPGVRVVFKYMDEPVTAENAPTVLLCAPEQVPQYRDAGLLMDLNTWINSKGWVIYSGSDELNSTGLTEEQKEDLEALFYEEGKQFGDDATWLMPFAARMLVMYYNATFIDENELERGPSLSWDVLVENCKKIKEIDPDSVPLAINDVDDTFISLCAQHGLSFTEDGWQELFGEEGIAIAKKLNDMYQKGYMTTAGLRGAPASLEEQAGMSRNYITIDSSDAAATQVPELDNEAYTYEADVMTLSRMAGDDPMVYACSSGLAICKSDDDDVLTAAWLLVKFMSVEADFQGGMAKDTGSLPTVRSAWMNEEFGTYLNESNGGSGLPGLVALMAQDQETFRFTASAFDGSARIREAMTALLEMCMTFTGDVDAQIREAFANTLAECTK